MYICKSFVDRTSSAYPSPMQRLGTTKLRPHKTQSGTRKTLNPNP